MAFTGKKKFFGREGIELEYDTILKGENGRKLTETDAKGVITSESLTRPAQNGENITLSIDVLVQEKLYGLMRSLAQDVGFRSGAGILMDVNTGGASCNS